MLQLTYWEFRLISLQANYRIEQEQLRAQMHLLIGIPLADPKEISKQKEKLQAQMNNLQIAFYQNLMDTERSMAKR